MTDETPSATDTEQAAPLAGKRVAILVQNLPVPFDRRVWQEATTLKKAGADVTVICPSDPKHPIGDFTIDGISVTRYPAPPEASGVVGYVGEYGFSLTRMRKALKKARQAGRFDSVHFCNPPDMLYLVAKALKKDKSVLIFDQHDLGPELVEAKHMPLSPRFVGVAKFFERGTYKAADHVISTNRSYKEIALGRGGFRDDEVTIVRSGPSRAWPNEGFTKKDWHNGHEYLIGYVGVMGRQEGIEYLLNALPKLVNEHGLDVGLSLIGSGPDRDRLEGLAKSLGLGDRVVFHGRVSDEDMKSILSDSDVCVNPDEVNKMNDLSTMNKIIEYMSLGRPIVQFDVREGRYSAEESSLYAAANDTDDFAAKIAQVLTDPELAARMGEYGRERFDKEICWEHQGELLVEAYRRILN